MQRDLHASQGVKTGSHVVKHDAHASAKTFKVAQWRRLYDIEPAKKYKAQQQRFPRGGDRDVGDELARHLLNHNKMGDFWSRGPADSGGSGDTHHAGPNGGSARHGRVSLVR